MTSEFESRIKNKKDTESNWESNNPVILDGEIIIVITNTGEKKLKIGNGRSTYNQLPFETLGLRPNTWLPTPEEIDAVPNSEKGQPNGVAPLNSSGKVPIANLPPVPGASQYTATITTDGWTKDISTGISTKVVNVVGLKANQTVIVATDYQGDDTAFVNQKNQFLTYITNGHVESIENGAKFSIYGEPPTIPINIIIVAFITGV